LKLDFEILARLGTLDAPLPRYSRQTQELMLVDEFRRRMGMEQNKQLFMSNYLRAPNSSIHRLQLLELSFRELESLPVNVFVEGRPADGRFFDLSAAAAAIDNPFQYPHVHSS
jgi:hypothetical protein